MANVPEELINEILLWLPVKSLLRFRCVCESFCASIGSQSFINSHFKRCSENRIHRKPIDLRVLVTENKSVEVRALDSSDGFQRELVLENCYSFDIYSAFFSYCNGLVLLYLWPCNLSVWNPSTRKYRILPDFPVKDTCIVCFGLGYDSTVDDYKAVHISTHGRDIYQVWIFELRSICWRRIQDFPCVGLETGGNGDCFVDGALHFICRDRNVYGPRKIVAFDVAKETFSVASEPVHRTKGSPFHLHVLGGCLSASVFMKSTSESQIDIYVRKKDGVAFTWTRLYSVTKQQFSAEIFDCFLDRKVAFSKEGDKVFLAYNYNGKLCSYDIKEKSLQEIVTKDMVFFLDIFSCTESLVFVGSQDGEEY